LLQATILPKNFSKPRIPPTVQECRRHMTLLRYYFSYSTGGTESQCLFQTRLARVYQCKTECLSHCHAL